MSDQVIPNGNRIFDANGVPVSGALVYVYQAGTLTPASVWADASAIVALSNPVVADANGYVAQVYVDESVRTLVKDATGAVLYDLDPAPRIVYQTLAASAVSFTSTANIPYSDVQSAVQGVDTNWRAAVGAIGIGVTGSPALDTNLDDGTAAAGFTYYNGTTLGTPPTGLSLALGGTVWRFREDASNMRQVITRNSPSRWWVRDLQNGTWSAWLEIVSIPQGSIVGDMFYRTTGGSMALLHAGTVNQTLRVNATADAPQWVDGWTQLATGQTITSGGALTFTHSLGARPRALSATLTCTTADAGFSNGDVILIDLMNNTTASNRQNSVLLTTADVTIRFSSAGNVFSTAHATTGATTALTNANWTLSVYASL